LGWTAAIVEAVRTTRFCAIKLDYAIHNQFERFVVEIGPMINSDHFPLHKAFDMERINQLTARQRDCLRLVMQHLPSKEIARVLAISPNTVDQHLRAAMAVLGATSRVSAAKYLAAHEAESLPQPLNSPSLRMAESAPAQHFEPTFGDQETGTGLANGLENSASELFEERIESRVKEYQANYVASYPQMAPFDFRSVIPWDGRRQNDLTTVQRLGWIGIISIGTTLAFGTLIAGLDALSRLT
jgi:DNA-binding CsgD family transcriptional regulator